MATPSRRAGVPPARPKKKPAPSQPKPPAVRRRIAARQKRGMDFYHLLALVSGAFAGLALYAWVTPGQMPGKEPIVQRDPRADLMLAQLKGRREADGFMHVHGAIVNGRQQTCRLASVTVTFFDKAGKQVANTMATAEAIAGRSRHAFEVRAHAPEAVRFEVAVDLAQFEPAHGRP